MLCTHSQGPADYKSRISATQELFICPIYSLAPPQNQMDSHITSLPLSRMRCSLGRCGSGSHEPGTAPALAIDSTSDALNAAASVPTPTWDADISHLFSAPYWLPESSRSIVGSGWINAMKNYGPWDLASYTTVKDGTPKIYQHLRSRSMPLTDDPTHYFPVEALEMIRSWANQGYRKNDQDEIILQEVIGKPEESKVKYRVRKDIRSLTQEELQTYREKLDTVLNAGDAKGKWQELGILRKSDLSWA